jgi:hypothetical protein
MRSYTQSNNLSATDIVKAHLNNLRDYLNFFGLYKRRYRNYIPVAYDVLRKKYPIRAILRDGSRKEFSYYIQVFYDLRNISFDVENDIVYVDNLRFVGGKNNGDIVHIFMNKDYEFLPVHNRVVLDIGANIADSSIYFASQGAKMVYGIEPDKDSFELAKENVRINNLSDRIIIIWCGCSRQTNEGANGSSPPLISLNDLMKKYNILPDILKIDCEGCEYDIILSSPDEVLKLFKYMQIEYHLGYRNLKDKLEGCGFSVEVTGPTYYRDIHVHQSNTHVQVSEKDKGRINKGYTGWILARRVQDNTPA